VFPYIAAPILSAGTFLTFLGKKWQKSEAEVTTRVTTK
jgi:hypothetical protein